MPVCARDVNSHSCKRSIAGAIACPRCGSAVRIPLFWIAGIEGIFRCKSCGLAFKTGYKAGAALSATGLVLSLCTVQLLVYLLGSYSLLLGLALIVTVWLFYGFHLRKRYMLYRIRRRMRRNTDDEQRAA